MTETISTENKGGYKTIVYFICFVAAMGGFLFGLDQGFIANALDTIEGVYHIGIAGGEDYSKILAIGGIFGALLSGIFARFLGRKKSLILAGFIFTFASVYSALLPPINILSALRFLLGFGVGVASFIVPLYLSETAPAKIRGSMGTLFQLLITIGIFLISLSNVFIAKYFVDPKTSLPLMFIFVAIFAGLMFLGTFILPESPRWLMLVGKRKEAEVVLQKTLSNQEEIDLELFDIEEALKGPKNDSEKGITFGLFFKVLLVGIFLQVFQQLVGINMMIYYAPTIFGFAGITGLLGMMTVPTVNMLFTFPAISLVEKWGRKMLLYVGAVCMLIKMLAAGYCFMEISKISAPAETALNSFYKNINQEQLTITVENLKGIKFVKVSESIQTPEIQQMLADYKAHQATPEVEPAEQKLVTKLKEAVSKAMAKDLAPMVPSEIKWILLIAIIIYIFGFAVSWGPVAWLVCSEIFPIKYREIGMTVTTMVNWTFAGLVMGNALTFMQQHGNASIFFVFGGFCIIAILFVAVFVPETKGITLEEMELNLRDGKALRDLGTPPTDQTCRLD